VLSRVGVEEILNQVQNDNYGFYFEMEREFIMDRKKLEETILAKSKDGKIPCAVCFKIADDLGVPKKEITKVLNEMKIKISQCQLGCFE
jgi:hypothetical protein